VSDLRDVLAVSDTDGKITMLIGKHKQIILRVNSETENLIALGLSANEELLVEEIAYAYKHKLDDQLIRSVKALKEFWIQEAQSEEPVDVYPGGSVSFAEELLDDYRTELGVGDGESLMAKIKELKESEEMPDLERAEIKALQAKIVELVDKIDGFELRYRGFP